MTEEEPPANRALHVLYSALGHIYRQPSTKWPLTRREYFEVIAVILFCAHAATTEK
jgi:hypothetical protein